MNRLLNISVFLMVMNRLWEHIPGARITGKVEMRLKDRLRNIYAPDVVLPDFFVF